MVMCKESLKYCAYAGQRSLLDIQREEAERAAAAQAAEAAEAAANRGPAITAAPSGWAKVAGANLPPTYQGELSKFSCMHCALAPVRHIFPGVFLPAYLHGTLAAVNIWI
jgi:hypothetical protein